LFATLDTLSREVDLGGGYRFRVSDTVGFIRKLPHHLVASFRATLDEVQRADLLLHVIDASHPAWEEQADVVEHVLADLGVGEANDPNSALLNARARPQERKRVIYLFNKADLLTDAAGFLVRMRERYPHALLTAGAPTRDGVAPGVEELRNVLRASAQALRPVVRVRVPVGDGKLLAALHRDTEILTQEQAEDSVLVTARVEARLLGWLRHEGVGVEILG
jgi:GTP-binding protein HflX